ncbi:MAG: RagB/SusD family nutrient uptake outer membrane protein [Candidatus Limisoma sp.]|nr:RagB/SusD family nutrient uptake outer membrane protein [Bacteroidales bacterium]
MLNLIKKSLLIASCTTAMAVMMASCTNIDEIDDGRLTDKAVFGNPKKVAGYLNYCYANLTSRGMVLEGTTMLASYCDEAYDVYDQLNGAPERWMAGRVTSFDNPITNPGGWSNCYEGIRKCNKFLENIDEAETYDEDERESFRAQAYGLRAYYYLCLIKNYGGVPLILNSIGLDIPADTKRASFAECARQIISDCEKVLEVSDDNIRLTWFSGTLEDDRYRFSKGMACAIMSEAALYAASPLNNDGTFTWAEAAEVTKRALDLCLEHGYELFKTAPTNNAALSCYDLYFTMRSDVQGVIDKETIMESPNQMSVWSDNGLPSILGQVKAGACPTQELIDSYETIDGKMPILGYADAQHLEPIINPEATLYNEQSPYTNRDPRLESTIYHYNSLLEPGGKVKIDTRPTGAYAPSESSIRNTRTGYYLRKFFGYKSDRSTNFDGYFKIFRLAELYLNYAEALNEASQGSTPQAALDAINAVRERVGMPAIEAGISTDDFRTRVRNERRVELAFEDHRFYDVRRWNILNEDKAVTGISVIPGKLGRVTYERVLVSDSRVATTDKYLRLPIPGDEINKLKTHTGTDFQNVGW